MRCIAAIFLGVLLLGGQAAGVLWPASAAVRKSCCGCDCTHRDCCNTRNTSGGERVQPLAALRNAASTPARRAVKANPAGVRPHPQPSPTPAAAGPSVLSFAPGAPLYERYCALLL